MIYVSVFNVLMCYNQLLNSVGLNRARRNRVYVLHGNIFSVYNY